MSRDAALATFRALADPVRLEIVDRIASGHQTTSTELASVMPITRQGIARHLRTLHGAGLIRGRRVGRRHEYRVSTEPIAEAERWLARRTESWDRALDRLVEHLEG